MNRHPASGTLGTTQLLVFANAGSADACRAAASELGFTQLAIHEGNIVGATEFLAQHPSPEILLIELGSQDDAPAQLDALANMVNPHTKVLATGKVDSIRFFHWLSELGIDGYLLQPFTAAELKQAIAKGSIKKDASAATRTAPSKLIAVVGANGGVGTTTLATNMAATCARDYQLTTALIDLDPYFGSVALALDVMPGKGMRDALDKPDRVDALFLERVMVKPFGNLAVLSAEEPLHESLVVQPNAGEMVLGALRENFHVIVADVPRQMNPLSRHVLAQADHVIVVAEPHVTALRDALRYKDYLVENLKRPAPMLVLNRTGLSADNEISAQEIEKNYGHAVAASLAFAHEAITAGIDGALFDSTPKLAALQREVRALTGKLVAAEEAAAAQANEKRSSPLSRFLGKK